MQSSFATVKNISKNELKERIGYNVQSAMEASSSLVEKVGDIVSKGHDKKAGSVLKSISRLQKLFLNKATSLIENDTPFKKASRSELEESETISYQVSNRLNVALLENNTDTILKTCESLEKDMSNCKCLR